MASISIACPQLATPDIEAATAWYRDALGFEVKAVYDDYGIVVRDGVELHFWKCPDRKIAEATGAYIRTENVDALREDFARAGELGGRVSTVEDRPWGMREFHVWDPSGNLLRIGAPIGARAERH